MTFPQRKIEKVVVGLGEELKSVKEKYLAVLEHFVKRLSQCGVLGEKGAFQARSTLTNHPCYYYLDNSKVIQGCIFQDMSWSPHLIIKVLWCFVGSSYYKIHVQ